MPSSSVEGDAPDPLGLGGVDLEAALQLAHRALAQVLAAGAACCRLARGEVEDDALAQRAARRPQLVDAEVRRQRVEDRQAAADDGAPLVAKPGQCELVGAARLEAALDQPAQSRRRDAAVADAACGEHLRDGADGAGGAERLAPVARRERPQRFLELGACRDLRFAKRSLAEAPPREVLHGQADAADLERLGLARPRAAAEDHLGRAAADVDDEAGHRRRLQARDAGEDQARLLAPGDDLDRAAENALRAEQEGVAVHRLAQRLGRHRAHLARREAVDPAREARQALEAARRCLVAEIARGIEPAAEAHRLLQVVDPVVAAAVQLADLETEAVRAHVDRGELAGPARFRAAARSGDGLHASHCRACGARRERDEAFLEWRSRARRERQDG